jgi:hypothetical protein
LGPTGRVACGVKVNPVRLSSPRRLEGARQFSIKKTETHGY